MIKAMDNEATSPECSRRAHLHTIGFSDREIAESEGCTVSAVYQWRLRRGLPPNKRRTALRSYPERERLYERGMNDRQIADACGCSVTAVWGWRQRTNRPAHTRPGQPLDLESQALRVKLVESGFSDREIGVLLDMSPSGVRSWRMDNGYFTPEDDE